MSVPKLPPKYGCGFQPSKGICARAMPEIIMPVSRAIIRKGKAVIVWREKMRIAQIQAIMPSANPAAPSVWMRRSAVMAPLCPIQFAMDVVCSFALFAAVFHEGSCRL